MSDGKLSIFDVIQNGAAQPSNVIDLHRRAPSTRDRALAFAQFVGSLTPEPGTEAETLAMVVRRAREICTPTTGEAR